MDKITDALGRVGAFAGGNKYLSALKNAFQAYMPATIAGAFAVLVNNVIISDTSGLGLLFPQVMALEPIKPLFDAVIFATLNFISIGIIFLLANELAISNGFKTLFPSVVAVLSFVTVSDLSTGGLTAAYTGTTGLFTGIFIAILSMSILTFLSHIEALKVKMPDTVPSGVGAAFEVLFPAILTVTIVSALGLICKTVTGSYVNELIFNAVQSPLQSVGGTLPGILILSLVANIFWTVGIHGNNLVAAIKEPLLLPLVLENMEAVKNGVAAPNIISLTFAQVFMEYTGSGTTIGLIVAIFIFSKRADNKAVAKLSLSPALFNINETVTFGIPIVMNPILAIPFIITPLVSGAIAYFLTVIGFCAKVVLNVPWTTPPLLNSFLATGGSWTGVVTQVICITSVILIYIPFFLLYEKEQNKEDLARQQEQA
ncbi:PTS sugar transporter subunit IIC [Clostridium vincentii]|uniref:Permease IIC component n=1 Tax=Clostridium vincentii TaxID=52704 RepID=A0A2T0B8S8_9CLOT|nr:PTS transporter subunit EIIC [Clostridium vincentii]PRR80296.1 Lichenan permease IIC component [Clostridium vincentii]